MHNFYEEFKPLRNNHKNMPACVRDEWGMEGKIWKKKEVAEQAGGFCLLPKHENQYGFDTDFQQMPVK